MLANIHLFKQMVSISFDYFTLLLFGLLPSSFGHFVPAPELLRHMSIWARIATDWSELILSLEF